MKPIQITFAVDTPEQLASFAQWYNGHAPAPTARTAAQLAPADNPAAGAPMPGDAASVFGAAGNAQAPAHSTAGAGQSSTAQGASADTSQSQDAAAIFAAQAAQGAQTVAGQTPGASHAQIVTDSSGLPWDARIHAGTKTKKEDGTWKSKKGTGAAMRAAVEGELRQALAIPFVPLNTTGTAPPPPPPAGSQTNTVAPENNAPPPPPAASDAANAPVTDFVSLCRYVTSRKLEAKRILEVCNRYGLAGLGLAAVRPDLIAALYADFLTGA